jgi:hypothetical protein
LTIVADIKTPPLSQYPVIAPKFTTLFLALLGSFTIRIADRQRDGDLPKVIEAFSQ